MSQEANQFSISGPIVINYSANSFGGIPLFSYKDAERDLQFKGDEVARVDTPVGELVTITVEDNGVSFAFTLVVPKIRIKDNPVGFDTIGIFTAPNRGLQVHQLPGVARVEVS
jgi:hypothetical protein